MWSKAVVTCCQPRRQILVLRTFTGAPEDTYLSVWRHWPLFESDTVAKQREAVSCSSPILPERGHACHSRIETPAILICSCTLAIYLQQVAHLLPKKIGNVAVFVDALKFTPPLTPITPKNDWI